MIRFIGKSTLLVATILLMFLAACGQLEIGLDQTATPARAGDISETEPSLTQAEGQDNSTPPSLPSLVHNAQAPEMISIGPYVPAVSTDIGMVVREENQISLQNSPVDFGLFWGYTPVTGRMAYSSEFWGPSEDGSNISVSDLWVYDYTTGQSEQWLEANVGFARWAPDGIHMAVAVWNLQAQRFDLVLISGPGQARVVAECTSVQFEWHPDGDKLVYSNLVDWAGARPECKGSYILTFSGGLENGTFEVEQVSTFGAEEQLSGQLNDRPIWALGQDALIILDTPFWVAPMDGLPAFVPRMPGGVDPLTVPQPINPIWVPELRQLVGFVETGMGTDGGVYVYQFSEDMQSITEISNLEWLVSDENSDLTLLDWWEPGKSILLLDHNMALQDQFLSEYWGKPVIWSLTDSTFIPIP
jgi:hypothetical protein